MMREDFQTEERTETDHKITPPFTLIIHTSPPPPPHTTHYISTLSWFMFLRGRFLGGAGFIFATIIIIFFLQHRTTSERGASEEAG
jgi:hypothetical protein